MASGFTPAFIGIMVACFAVLLIGLVVWWTRAKSNYTEKLKADARLRYAYNPRMLQEALAQIDAEERQSL